MKLVRNILIALTIFHVCNCAASNCRLYLKKKDTERDEDGKSNSTTIDMSKYPRTFETWLQQNPEYRYYEVYFNEPKYTTLVSKQNIGNVTAYNDCNRKLCKSSYRDDSEIHNCVIINYMYHRKLEEEKVLAHESEKQLREKQTEFFPKLHKEKDEL